MPRVVVADVLLGPGRLCRIPEGKPLVVERADAGGQRLTGEALRDWQ
jgi:hypothetical protein